MADKEYEPVRILRIKKTDDLKTIYAKAKKAFTAEDLLQYVNLEPGGISGEEMEARLKKAHKDALREMKKRKKKT